MIKTYILTYNSRIYQDSKVQAFITSSSYVLAYWNYIPFIYCIKSRLSSQELAEAMGFTFPQGGFFIAELNSKNVNGRLQSEAWPWFYDDKSTEDPPPSLLGSKRGSSLFGSLAPEPKPRGLFELGRDTADKNRK